MNGLSGTIVRELPTGHLEYETIDRILDELIDYGVAVSAAVDGPRWSATMSIPGAGSIAGAIARAERLLDDVDEATAASETITAEGMTFEEQDRLG
jgi:hypothetical protein